MSDLKINTKCLVGGYKPGNGEPRQIPIIQSTTFKYDTSEATGAAARATGAEAVRATGAEAMRPPETDSTVTS